MITTSVTPLPSSGDMDSYIELVSVSCKLDGTIKNTVRLIDDFVSDEIFIGRPCSEFDCTGRAFTSYIDFVKRVVSDGWVTKVYLHYISIDC